MKREICAVVTKGTLMEGEMLSRNPDASYTMAVTENCQSSENQQAAHIFGVCVVDVTTSKIVLGQVVFLLKCMFSLLVHIKCISLIT